ncbi:MAG: hypothetical protein JWO38_4210 [Gemmataceae bacterium]|nr:hypothetical protein [Gemmataceae bacterium]
MSIFRYFGNRLAVAAGLALVPTAVATPAAPGRTQPVHHKGAHSGSMVASELHAAHALLVKADHDYQGHRAKAAHEVAAAIREIAGTHHHHTGTGNHPAGQARTKIPQGTSDAHLTQASQILTAALGKLPAGHKATANIQAAINEIQTAFKIR